MVKLKLATYNIDNNRGDFPNRIYELSNIISKSKFDVLCIQDDFNSTDFSSAKFLNVELDYNYITTTISNNNLTILSKQRITLLNQIYLNQKKDRKTACQFIEVTYNNHKILLVNTKLSSIYSFNKKEQLDIILKEIEKYKNYKLIVFCGSLNINPNFPEIKKIKDLGFNDVNNEFTHQDRVISDYIFYKSKDNIQVQSQVILKGFSKHHCLVNIFKFS